MKKVNVKLIGIVCFLLIFCTINTFAQKKQKTEKESTKKVVIVKKIKDKDGKVRVERIEKEGAEAEKYIKELDIKGADKTMDDFVKEINSARVQSRDQESRNETKRNETKRNLNIAWKLKRHAAAFRPPQISLFRGKTHEFVSFTPWKSCCTTALNFRHVSGTIQQDRGGARFE